MVWLCEENARCGHTREKKKRAGKPKAAFTSRSLSDLTSDRSKDMSDKV